MYIITYPCHYFAWTLSESPSDHYPFFFYSYAMHKPFMCPTILIKHKNHSSTLRWHSWLKSLLMEERDPLILYRQYHCCWPSDTRSHSFRAAMVHCTDQTLGYIPVSAPQGFMQHSYTILHFIKETFHTHSWNFSMNVTEAMLNNL